LHLDPTQSIVLASTTGTVWNYVFMATLFELGLTLKDVDLGAIDAESDHNLANHFIKTTYATDILSARHEHVLGRKGSGKSALFRQLQTVVADDVIVEQVETNQAVWSLLKQYEDRDNPNREAAFVTAWSYVLALLTAQAIVKANLLLSEPSRRAFVPAQKFLEANFPTGTSPVAMARSFIKRIRTLDLQAFGIGGGISWEPDQTAEVASIIVEKVMAAVEPTIREVGMVLALDKLDDAWDGSADSKSMMVGLLQAAKDLNDRFGFRNANDRHLRILSFIRSDIYESLDFDDKDKHRPLELPITWTPESLAQMVTARLPEGVGVDDLLGGGMRGDANPFNYIVGRTFMRPREVLQFLGEAKKDCGKAATVISAEAIRSAEERYSAWKVDDLKQEYSKSDQDLATLLECLRQGAHRYDSIEDLEEIIASKAPQLLSPPDITPRTLVQKLFGYSVIGVRVGNSGSARFKCEIPQLTLPTTGMVYVHPSLHKGLLIKEARKDRKPSDGAVLHI